MNEKLADQLRAEYLLLQNHYETYDARALTIKSWGTLLISGALAVGLKEKSQAILIIAALAAAWLWILEGMWKAFQYCYADRIVEIEKWFRGDQSSEISPFQVYTSWLASWRGHYRKLDSMPRILRQPFVFLPYLPIIFISVIGVLWASLY